MANFAHTKKGSAWTGWKEDGVSSGLSAGWVYYERLKMDGYENLYNTLNSRLDAIKKPNISNKTVKQLKQIADKETEKELYFLKDVFNIDLTQTIKVKNMVTNNGINKNAVRKMIDGLNRCLNLPDVYDRCVDRIKIEDDNLKKQGKVGRIAKITIAEFFPSYFETQKRIYIDSNYHYSLIPLITEMAKNLLEEALKEGWDSNQISEKFEIEANKIIEDRLEKTIETALEKMFKSSDFNKGFEKSMKAMYGGRDDKVAYQEVYNWIQQTKGLKNGNPLLETFYEAYQLEEFKEKLKEIIKNNIDISKMLPSYKEVNNELKKQKVSQNSYATGAVSEELIRSLAELAVPKRLLKNGSNYQMKSLTTGSANAKADIVFTFELKDSQIMENVSKIYDNIKAENKDISDKSKRKTNIEMHKELVKNIKDKKGHIIYASAKNYTLNDEFERHGFSSGSKISLNTYKEVMQNLEDKERLDTFLGAIVNTIGESRSQKIDKSKKTAQWEKNIGSNVGGAIGAKKAGYKEKLEDYLALDIAYFLFDDVVRIGKAVSDEGINELHLMNLDELYIPLSFILYLLYLSFKRGVKTSYEAKQISNATITPDPQGILYPLGFYSDISDGSTKWGEKAWITQRETAFNKTTVGIHFLRNFRDLVREFL